MSVSLLLSALMLTGSEPPSLRFADVHLSTGVRLRYAEQGDPHGHPVILLHGYSDSWVSFSRVLPLLDRRYHVYALDLRGHGESDRPEAGYDMRGLAADVVAFMNSQRLARVTVVGHSMGSMVAQQVALAVPERVARLVLVGAVAAPNESATLRELNAVVQTLRDPVPEEFVREFQIGTVHGVVPERFMNQAIAESRKLPARVWRGLIAGMVATQAADGLGESSIPTLILWGERDATFSRAEQDGLVRLIGTAELSVYPETGHALHWEQPDRFVRDLHGFMNRTTSY
jgi:pimeloyl-ACP methyl ester carboxylesterase